MHRRAATATSATTVTVDIDIAVDTGGGAAIASVTSVEVGGVPCSGQTYGRAMDLLENGPEGSDVDLTLLLCDDADRAVGHARATLSKQVQAIQRAVAGGASLMFAHVRIWLAELVEVSSTRWHLIAPLAL